MAKWHLANLVDALLVMTELVQIVAQHTHAGGEIIPTPRSGAQLIETFDEYPAMPGFPGPLTASAHETCSSSPS